jgi:hypothetical protein
MAAEGAYMPGGQFWNDAGVAFRPASSVPPQTPSLSRGRSPSPADGRSSEYRCDCLVAQVLEEFRIERGRLPAIHEVGGLHAGRLELMGR